MNLRISSLWKPSCRGLSWQWKVVCPSISSISAVAPHSSSSESVFVVVITFPTRGGLLTVIPLPLDDTTTSSRLTFVEAKLLPVLAIMFILELAPQRAVIVPIVVGQVELGWARRHQLTPHFLFRTSSSELMCGSLKPFRMSPTKMETLFCQITLSSMSLSSSALLLDV